MKHFIMALVLGVFVIACADDDSAVAVSEEMEIALNDRNYDKIISTLGSKDVDTLADRQKYVLQCAYMGQAGFDPIANLGELLGDDSNDNPLNILVGAQGTVSQIEAKGKSALYELAADIQTNHNPSQDPDILMAGSVASALKIVTDVATVTIGTCISGVSFDSADTNYIGTCLQSGNSGNISNEIVSTIKSSLGIMQQLATDSSIDGKVQDKIKDILKDIGCVDTGCTTVDNTMIFKYLNEKVFN